MFIYSALETEKNAGHGPLKVRTSSRRPIPELHTRKPKEQEYIEIHTTCGHYTFLLWHIVARSEGGLLPRVSSGCVYGGMLPGPIVQPGAALGSSRYPKNMHFGCTQLVCTACEELPFMRCASMNVR